MLFLSSFLKMCNLIDSATWKFKNLDIGTSFLGSNLSFKVFHQITHGKMMNSALGHVGFEGCGADWSVGTVYDRRGPFRRYLHLGCKWNLEIKQVIESMLSEDRRETRISPGVVLIVWYLLTNCIQTLKDLYVEISGEYGLFGEVQKLRGESKIVWSWFSFLKENQVM